MTRERIGALALALAYAALWMLGTHYEALEDDAHLYALQALARLHPNEFGRDVFLSFGSQDRFTLFTPVYAWLIGQFGLARAAALLVITCHAASLWAAWHIARAFGAARLAALALGLVIVVPGIYGSGEAFQYRETFLTARLPAEAAVLGAIAFALHGRVWFATACGLIGLAMHPLMALPALALGALWIAASGRASRRAIVIALVTVGIVGVGLLALTDLARPLPADWLSLIHARNGYMFPTNWSLTDWNTNLLPVFSLTFSAFVFRGRREATLATCLAVIAVSGLALALIAGDLLPLQIVVQVQPWRWVWLPKLIAVILLPSTLATAWTRGANGRAAAVVVGFAWLATPPAGMFIALFAVALWTARNTVSRRVAHFAAAISGVAVILNVVSTVTIILGTSSTQMRDAWLVERAIDLVGVPAIATAAAALAWHFTLRRSSYAAPAVVTLLALALWGARAPETWHTWANDPYPPAARATFAAWRVIIPPGSNVMWVTRPTDVWFLLDRASYASQTQSAGIVFSYAAAKEIERRANVLSPLVDPRWLIGLGADMPPDEMGVRSLDAATLAGICADYEMDYVVSRDDAGPATATITQPGSHMGLRLYACESPPRARHSGA